MSSSSEPPIPDGEFTVERLHIWVRRGYLAASGRAELLGEQSRIVADLHAGPGQAVVDERLDVRLVEQFVGRVLADERRLHFLRQLRVRIPKQYEADTL